VDLGLVVEFAVVFAVGVASLDRRDPILRVGFAGPIDCHRTALQPLGDRFVGVALGHVQEDPSAQDRLGAADTAGNERRKLGSLVWSKVDIVFWLGHS
jgi:hypothetical protein